jgi:hypothetical protein
MSKKQDLAAAMPPGHFRMILNYKPQAPSSKLQALDIAVG